MNINRGDAEQRKNSAPLRLSGKKTEKFRTPVNY